MPIETQLLDGCRRLAGKGFFNTPVDSFSMRIPGKMEMILASGQIDWRQIEIADLHTASLFSREGLCGLHASIYRGRADAGAVAISSPKWVHQLARFGGLLPPVFDEQVRHIGSYVRPLPDEDYAHCDMVRKTFSRGANAALLGERLLCLGMTCERVLFNTELYEKCAQAYVIAKASGNQIRFIPVWVRLIANHRLLRDERRAAGSYRNGCIPENINTY
ncbi:MAG: class II aldolase/adducin family protein [Terracidiphilus sp.]|jgi:ribulose-5-phosphate 4-epimerase/fuculose-1-phosphate aldolase